MATLSPERREQVRQATRKWQAANRKHDPLGTRRRNVWHKYRLTLGQLTAIWSDQGCVCAGCGDAVSDPGLPVSKHGCHVDHCHTTNEVRGILCRACNITLGMVQDQSTRLRGLIAYLEKHHGNTLGRG